MRRIASAVAVLAWIVGCGPPPVAHGTPVHTVVTVKPPVAVSPPPVTAAPSSCGALAIRELPVAAPAGWGSTEPSVWLTEQAAGLDVWYPGGDEHAPYEMARLTAAGALEGARDVEPFAGKGEAFNPVVATDAGLTAIAETVYRTQKDADIMLALGSRGRWTKPVVLQPNPDLDTDPAVAFSGGRIGVAWRHGVYPMAPDISFAVVGRDGRVLHGEVVENDAEAEGISVVGVPGGWLLLYTPSSALPSSRRALVAMRIDEGGRVVSRTTVAKESAIWPVAAWNGREVGVAFSGKSDDRGVVRFVRLRPDGTPIAPPVVADRHPDPLASFRALSLLPSATGWWLGDVAGFHASVMSARASEARVAHLDPRGAPLAATAVSTRETGASLVRIAAHGDGIRGVYVEDRGATRLRAFDLACGAAQPAAPVDACAAHSEPLKPGTFGPLGGLVESSVELGGDLVVGHRPTQYGSYGATAGNVFVSRLRRDGTSAWNTDLGATFNPSLATSGDRVATVIKTDGGSHASLVLLDAGSGAVLKRREIAVNVGGTCVAPAASGWLVVHGGSYDGATHAGVLMLGADGAQRDKAPLDEPIATCSLLRTPRGYLLAYTHGGQVSETSYLFVRELDARGRARGPGTRLPDRGFATAPQLVRRGTTPVVLFEDALGRKLGAVVLGDHGAPRSGLVEVAETYGLYGAALWGDAIVWTTDEGLGRRGCLDTLLAPH